MRMAASLLRPALGAEEPVVEGEERVVRGRGLLVEDATAPTGAGRRR
jgi:hypothetical protein